MGIPDSSLLDLIEKVRSWIPWGGSDISGVSQEYWTTPHSSFKMCWECETRVTEFGCKCHCKHCGRVLCGRSVSFKGTAETEEYMCKSCSQDGSGIDTMEDYCVRVDSSPRDSPERGFNSFDREKFSNNDNTKATRSENLARFLDSQHHDSSPRAVASSSSYTDHLSPISFRRSSSRSDEEDAEDSRKQLFSPLSEFSHDVSDIDSNSISATHDFYGSSPLDSPCRIATTPTRAAYMQREQEGMRSYQKASHPFEKENETISRRFEVENEYQESNDESSHDMSIHQNQYAQQPLDFESNGLIWFPPPPDEEEDDIESDFFKYADDDDDMGGSDMVFPSSSFSTDTVSVKEKLHEEPKEPLRAMVHGHFRALVSQLLQGEGILMGNESDGDDWLDIVSSLAWQAANFVKPDTSKGGSMDPGDYVKVKCIVSGRPKESTLIKGVVCTKNIKHKRMTSQYRNPRLFLMRGSIEYQRDADQLASFNTLLQQEIDHLKMVVSKIEAHRPNVLLVEKSVSSYAQEYLLEKEISLVLNVKRPLLERIARCTGAHIVPSTDNLSQARVGHCEVFRLERVLEDCATASHPNKKLAKTLMFFEGCQRRLGCTVLLKGAALETLKKVKHVVQYAVFAAYHLSLETSFLADEGATLPKLPPTPPARVTENLTITEGAVSIICNSSDPTDCLAVACQHQDLGKRSMSGTSIVQLASDNLQERDQIPRINSELDEWESSHGHVDVGKPVLSPGIMEYSAERKYPDLPHSGLVEQVGQVFCNQQQWKEQGSFSVIPSELELSESSVQEEESTLRSPTHSGEVHEPSKADTVELNDVSSEYFSTVDNQQSILVSFSSRCVLKGTVCERSQLLRIKFYGSFDKPLGRYLRDDLFDQTSCCRSCNERTDAHVLCYTHQQGNLTINVKQLPELDLPGKRDGKIWMWHRCLRCAHKDGVPPATPRGIMSDAAWGLSFGKFLELSFSNHATANRVASCGHSLQRDCLRYYGFGSMVAFFRYSPIDILSVRLPRSMLEFGDQVQLEWVKNEAVQVSRKMEVLYAEVFDVLHKIEQRGVAVGLKCSDDEEFHYNIADLKDLLKMERNEYESLLQPVDDQDTETVRPLDILELNRLRRCLLIDSYFWDRRLYALDSLLKTNSSSPVVDSSSRLDSATYIKLKEWRDESFCKDNKLVFSSEENISKPSKLGNSGHNSSLDLKENPLFLDHIPSELTIDQKSLKSDECCTEDPDSPFHHHNRQELVDEEVSVVQTSMESVRSPVGSLSDKIDSAWTGTGQQSVKDRFLHLSQPNGSHTESVGQTAQVDNPSLKRVMAPARVYSFDSAVRLQEKMRRELSPPPLSSLRSFHASGEYMSMVRDPVPNMLRTFSQVSFPSETKKLKFIFNSAPSFISSASQMAGEGVRLLLPQTGRSNIVIPVYDNEPTSVISYALGSKEYEDWISNALVESGGVRSAIDTNRVEILASSFSRSATSTFSVWQSSSSIDSDDLFYRSHASEDASSTTGSLFSDTKRSPHVRISFGDESSSLSGKAKFSVVCYFARQFDALRKTCCPREVDFISSLSRGKKWNAQGGKSNVYFAKSLDDRFIIKQITKTELDSFEEFAPEYFKYLMDSLTSGSPTCLAKVLGIYQVSVKHLKGGRGETKLDIMVMENLFFRKKITSIYDLKGSLRSRYNSDPTGKDKVLLDMNLLETMRTNPMFLGSKAKRSLERAVWNDTSFLASIDVMDYSLLVGVDEENKELVLGIIDYIRQYTWDKHLETWVKASGILGGPKNESPTVISPKQYKKRFRKAMSTYFLTVPEQWSS